jgi:hypothetical protein
MVDWAKEVGQDKEKFTPQKINKYMATNRINKRTDENRVLYWEGIDLIERMKERATESY